MTLSHLHVVQYWSANEWHDFDNYTTFEEAKLVVYRQSNVFRNLFRVIDSQTGRVLFNAPYPKKEENIISWKEFGF